MGRLKLCFVDSDAHNTNKSFIGFHNIYILYDQNLIK